MNTLPTPVFTNPRHQRILEERMNDPYATKKEIARRAGMVNYPTNIEKTETFAIVAENFGLDIMMRLRQINTMLDTPERQAELKKMGLNDLLSVMEKLSKMATIVAPRMTPEGRGGLVNIFAKVIEEKNDTGTNTKALGEGNRRHK